MSQTSTSQNRQDRPHRRFIGRSLQAASSAVLSALALCVLPACDFAFYQPSHQVLPTAVKPKQDVWLEASDGVRLHAWLFRTEQTPVRGMVLLLHGNSGNVSSQHQRLAWLVDHGYDLFVIDYRGYGLSEGTASRGGVALDALAAIEFASQLSRSTEPVRDVIVLGQSLGGAVAVDAVAALDTEQRQRIRTVVLEGTFHSYSDIGGGIFWRTGVFAPIAGFGYALVSDDHAPWKVIGQLSPIPVLVVHAVGDPVIPFEYGAALYRAAQEPKRFWAVDQDEHIWAFRDESVRRALLGYLERCR